jgi:hypothetical protein
MFLQLPDSPPVAASFVENMVGCLVTATPFSLKNHWESERDYNFV